MTFAQSDFHEIEIIVRPTLPLLCDRREHRANSMPGSRGLFWFAFAISPFFLSIVLRSCFLRFTVWAACEVCVVYMYIVTAESRDGDYVEPFNVIARSRLFESREIRVAP